MAYPQPDDDCYDECKAAQPAGPGGQLRCICQQINAEDEAYRAEPPEMFAREWGSY
ncbi:hypothetical protein ABZX75_17580 [Streptomyces sp. NPDC003038]|uniref:hypothetical protein n=1 Tax=unclassified Streptomyces TaxID=2593676 RepID=UPI0033AB7CC1